MLKHCVRDSSGKPAKAKAKAPAETAAKETKAKPKKEDKEEAPVKAKETKAKISSNPINLFISLYRQISMLHNKLLTSQYNKLCHFYVEYA